MSDLSTPVPRKGHDRRHPLETFLDALNELDAFVKNYHSGTMTLSGILRAVADDADSLRGGQPTENTARLRTLAEEVLKPVKDKQYLHELIVIRLWTVIEVTVDDTLMLRLTTDDWWRTSELTRRVKGHLVAFACLSLEQQLRLLLDEISIGTTASHRRGVDGLEELLDKVGLGGPIDSVVRRVLIQLAATRNIIMHNHGIVDARFRAHCPWLAVEPGTRLAITLRDVWVFRTAVAAYIYGLMRRMQDTGLYDPGEEYKDLFVSSTANLVRLVRVRLAEESEGHGTTITGASDGTS